MRLLLLTVILVLINISRAQNGCIFLTDCAIAIKYIEKRRTDPETIKLLQRAHCGIVDRGNGNEPKILCSQIPQFDENCKYLDDCPAALALIEKDKFNRQTIQLLRSAACGYSDQKDMILCNRFQEQIQFRNIDILPKYEECGLQMPISKITGGKFTEIDDFPWIALLKYKNSTGHTSYQCHGTLISSKYILTAAHCLKLEPHTISKYGNLYSVVLGEYDIRNETDCVYPEYGGDCNEPVQEIFIESVKYHSNFGLDGPGSDIGLIRLKKKAVYTSFVKPICLPLKDYSLKEFEPLWVAGWGKTENKTMSNIKLKARIFYLPKEECKNRINYEIDNTQICAGSDDGSDSCRGDSGGPLMAQKVHKGEYKSMLAGVVSFGLKCGSRAAVYTNTSAFVNWILDNIKP